MTPPPKPDPLRKVVTADLREGQSINNNQLTKRWWELKLECGHIAERRVRFPKQEGPQSRGFAALHHPRPRSEALPPLKRCRCWECGRELNGSAP